MIFGVVGTYNDLHSAGCLRGNGKTCTMTYYGYMDYLEERTILSNYFTNFSEQLTTQEIVELFFSQKDLKNITILIDEIQIVLNSIGTKGSALKFIMKMAGQTRKRKADIYYTTQRYYDLHRRMRVQTDVVLEPHKYHYYINSKNELELIDMCYSDTCKKEHVIIVTGTKPKVSCIDILIPENICLMYNTNEIIDEEIKL